MSFQGLRRMLLGEPMPDKNDPKYKERYERDVAAGAKFAEATGLAWLGRHYVAWAEKSKKLFFVIVLTIMTLFVIGNFYRFAVHVNGNAVETQRSVLKSIKDNKSKGLGLKQEKDDYRHIELVHP